MCSRGILVRCRASLASLPCHPERTQTVQIVESNRPKFRNMTDAELHIVFNNSKIDLSKPLQVHQTQKKNTSFFFFQ